MRDSPITAATLSRWLRVAGTLPRGAVVGVQVELETDTPFSSLVFLTATYSSDASNNLTPHLMVKSPLSKIAQPGVREESSEVQFYRLLAPVLGSPPLARCYAAIDDAERDRGRLVLEDLRFTHDHPSWPIPPSRNQCLAAVDALARVHAQWWEAPALGKTIGKPHTTESLTNMVQGVASHLPAFLDFCGDALSSDARQILQRVFSSPLKPWLRLTDERALTIIHGDAHSWNFLFPRTGDGAAVLIDWQLWHVDVGARDLAFFIALHWYPSRRREFERPLIEYYYDRLLKYGVQNYSFNELWLDYRRCVVRNLTIPIIFWSRGMNPEGWWQRLECALMAYRDLACDELL
jgi:hypothetical protein